MTIQRGEFMSQSGAGWFGPAGKHGLIFGAFLIFYGVLYRVLHLDEVPGLVWVFYLAPPLAAFMANRETKAARRALAFKKGFQTGAVAALLAAVIYGLNVFAYNQFIDDSVVRDFAESFRARLLVEGQTIEQAGRATSGFLFTPPGFAIFIFIRMALVSLISAAVLAFFMRSKGVAAGN